MREKAPAPRKDAPRYRCSACGEKAATPLCSRYAVHGAAIAALI
ncbi:MAG: hypothetical protein WCL34_10920 [Methylococcaceae bacterium]